MKREYILLREVGASDKNGLLPEPELCELTLDELRRVRAHKEVIAVTANMPIALNSHKLSEAPEINDEVIELANWGIEAVGARATSLDGEGMIYAILDTGIFRQHPVFRGVDTVEEDFCGTGNGDNHGHGTHSAATVFGQGWNGVGFGIAPGIDRALVAKVIDDTGFGDAWSAVRALHWAACNGANVVSLSFRLCFLSYVDQLIHSGFPSDAAIAFALESYHTTIQFLEKYFAILKLRSEALVIVAGGGDSNRRLDNLAWDRWVEAPASISGVIAVGALQDCRKGYSLSDFSHSGPDGVAPGVGILSAGLGSDGLAGIDGSSAAANHVAGVALLWGEFLAEWGNLTSFSLEARLLRSGDTTLLRPGYRDVDVGCGLIQAPLEESERNPGDERESGEEKERTVYNSNLAGSPEILAFDRDPDLRERRRAYYRRQLR